MVVDVYVASVVCMDCQRYNMINKPFKFVYMASVTCTTVNRNFAVLNMLITCEVLKMASGVCIEVDKVREERFRRE